jgi:hypothetical protein
MHIHIYTYILYNDRPIFIIIIEVDALIEDNDDVYIDRLQHVILRNLRYVHMF